MTTMDASQLASLLDSAACAPSDAPAWLVERRAAARAHFERQGIPTIKDEAWRFTNVGPIGQCAFASASAEPGSIESDGLPDFLGGTAIARLVFVDGVADQARSTIGDLPEGVRVGCLGQIAAPELEPHLASHARADIEPFVALNTACMQDGVAVIVPDGVAIEAPVEIIHVSTRGGRVTHPRTLIVAGAEASCTVVETFIGTEGEAYFTNTVTEIVADRAARVDHYKVNLESTTAFHIGTVQIAQQGDSDVGSKAITFGGGLVRNNMNTVLDGEHCNCDLRGLSVIDGDRHVDNNLRVNHDKPNCDSRELFKNILDDRSRAVFTGRIFVAEDAQKTDAKQTSMSLLLSDDATANSNPQLEIFADDVKCTHGATIGELDPSAMFYLRARGLSEEAARSLLIYAFANESLEEIRVEPLRQALESMLVEKLPGAAVLAGMS